MTRQLLLIFACVASVVFSAAPARIKVPLVTTAESVRPHFGPPDSPRHKESPSDAPAQTECDDEPLIVPEETTTANSPNAATQDTDVPRAPTTVEDPYVGNAEPSGATSKESSPPPVPPGTAEDFIAAEYTAFLREYLSGLSPPSSVKGSFDHQPPPPIIDALGRRLKDRAFAHPAMKQDVPYSSSGQNPKEGGPHPQNPNTSTQPPTSSPKPAASASDQHQAEISKEKPLWPSQVICAKYALGKLRITEANMYDLTLCSRPKVAAVNKQQLIAGLHSGVSAQSVATYYLDPRVAPMVMELIVLIISGAGHDKAAYIGAIVAALLSMYFYITVAQYEMVLLGDKPKDSDVYSLVFTTGTNMMMSLFATGNYVRLGHAFEFRSRGIVVMSALLYCVVSCIPDSPPTFALFLALMAIVNLSSWVQLAKSETQEGSANAAQFVLMSTIVLRGHATYAPLITERLITLIELGYHSSFISNTCYLLVLLNGGLRRGGMSKLFDVSEDVILFQITSPSVISFDAQANDVLWYILATIIWLVRLTGAAIVKYSSFEGKLNESDYAKVDDDDKPTYMCAYRIRALATIPVAGSRGAMASICSALLCIFFAVNNVLFMVGVLLMSVAAESACPREYAKCAVPRTPAPQKKHKNKKKKAVNNNVTAHTDLSYLDSPQGTLEYAEVICDEPPVIDGYSEVTKDTLSNINASFITARRSNNARFSGVALDDSSFITVLHNFDEGARDAKDFVITVEGALLTPTAVETYNYIQYPVNGKLVDDAVVKLTYDSPVFTHSGHNKLSLLMTTDYIVSFLRCDQQFTCAPATKATALTVIHNNPSKAGASGAGIFAATPNAPIGLAALNVGIRDAQAFAILARPIGDVYNILDGDFPDLSDVQQHSAKAKITLKEPSPAASGENAPTLYSYTKLESNDPWTVKTETIKKRTLEQLSEQQGRLVLQLLLRQASHYTIAYNQLVNVNAKLETKFNRYVARSVAEKNKRSAKSKVCHCGDNNPHTYCKKCTVCSRFHPALGMCNPMDLTKGNFHPYSVKAAPSSAVPSSTPSNPATQVAGAKAKKKKKKKNKQLKAQTSATVPQVSAIPASSPASNAAVTQHSTHGQSGTTVRPPEEVPHSSNPVSHSAPPEEAVVGQTDAQAIPPTTNVSIVAAPEAVEIGTPQSKSAADAHATKAQNCAEVVAPPAPRPSPGRVSPLPPEGGTRKKGPKDPLSVHARLVALRQKRRSLAPKA